MKDLIKSKRINVFRDLQEKEKNLTFRIMKTGITEEKQAELKKVREGCWSGCVAKEDFFEVMKKYEFLNYQEHEVLEMLKKLNCFNPRFSFVSYVRLISMFYTK